jgi:hypothetical protein
MLECSSTCVGLQVGAFVEVDVMTSGLGIIDENWARTTSDDGKTMEVCFSTDDFVEMHVSSVVLGEVVVRTDDRVSEVVFLEVGKMMDF